jgi:hypothetical protein
MNKRLAAALENLTEAQARAVYEALGQYVDNQEEYVANCDEPEAKEVAKARSAREVMEKMDAVFIALAELDK